MLQTKNIKPARPLETDLQMADQVMSGNARARRNARGWSAEQSIGNHEDRRRRRHGPAKHADGKLDFEKLASIERLF